MSSKSTILLAKIAISQSRVAHYQTRILSKCYTKRIVYKYNELLGEREQLTPDELLEDEMNTLERHISNMETLLDRFTLAHSLE
jgi:hypothetical protein